MKDLEAILKEHPFFEDLDEKHLEFIAGCGTNVAFKAGEVILKEGGQADKFYLIRHTAR